MARGFTLFDTALGRCGIAWAGEVVAAVRLPEASDAETAAKLAAACPGAVEAQPPAMAQDAIARIAALLAGEPADLDPIPLDLGCVAPFAARVYALTRAIPPGRTLTYGDIARQLGQPGAARAVGHALGRNPWPVVVPCHRVLAAGNGFNKGMGGFTAPGGLSTKARLLAIEGALPEPAPDLFGN